MLQDIFRASNKVWYSMYLDELIEKPNYQISYLNTKSDRLYFNCAHTLTKNNIHDVEVIENYFRDKKLDPAIYLDPESPPELEPLLLSRGYIEIPEELEYWYKINLEDDAEKKRVETQNPPNLDVASFYPSEDPSLLNSFLTINAIANNLDTLLIEKLKKNLLQPKNPLVNFICFIAFHHNQPASIGLMGLYEDDAFFSEGGTHPDFRRQGIYKSLREVCIQHAKRLGARKIVVNCDREAFSNNAYQRLGFTRLCERRFLQQTATP
jgi:ribosomal protein S18 acetylase RimI-like enzyme